VFVNAKDFEMPHPSRCQQPSFYLHGPTSAISHSELHSDRVSQILQRRRCTHLEDFGHITNRVASTTVSSRPPAPELLQARAGLREQLSRKQQRRGLTGAFAASPANSSDSDEADTQITVVRLGSSAATAAFVLPPELPKPVIGPQPPSSDEGSRRSKKKHKHKHKKHKGRSGDDVDKSCSRKKKRRRDRDKQLHRKPLATEDCTF